MKKDIITCCNPECKKDFEEDRTNDLVTCPYCKTKMFPSTKELINPQKNNTTTS
jgi:DNA-directed RNA polymerase subunit RPC12/RpoP